MYNNFKHPAMHVGIAEQRRPMATKSPNPLRGPSTCLFRLGPNNQTIHPQVSISPAANVPYLGKPPPAKSKGMSFQFYAKTHPLVNFPGWK